MLTNALRLSANSQQYFSLTINQPPATSQQYFSLRINQHQPSTTSQTNRLKDVAQGQTMECISGFISAEANVLATRSQFVVTLPLGRVWINPLLLIPKSK
jgi:hypothetical protein